MEVIILTPNREGVFSKELEQRLSQLGHIVFKTEVTPLSAIPELKSASDKILALDPDFVNWSFTKDDIASIENLRAICLQTTSFGWIDTGYATERGIPVVNLRGFSTEAVAEFSLMMTLMLARKIPVVIHDGFKQDFVRHQGTELRGKTVGIVGLGSIGKRYAELCSGLGMKVMYWSRSSEDTRYESVELRHLISSADVIFPALADNDETKRIMTNELLAQMKPNALFVSIAHKLYDHDFVLNLAEQGKIAGYAFEEENGNPADHKGNVLALPALAWATDGSMQKNGELWTEAITDAAQGKYQTKIN